MKTSVIISPSSLDVITNGELVHSWIYVAGNPDEVEMPALAEVFGANPAVETKTVPCEGGPCVKSTASWSGFDLIWFPETGYPYGMFVRTTASQVGNVNILSSDGSRVGDDLQALSAAKPQYVRNLPSPEGEILQVGVDAVDPLDVNAPFPEFAIFVAIEGMAPFDKVTSIFAPRQNFGQ